MRNVIIIQARMGSSRLPNKAMTLIDGRPVIGYLLKRVQKVRIVDAIVVATSYHRQNDALADYVKQSGFAVFRGEEDDVLDRYYQAAQAYGAETVVRIMGDCPLIDPHVIERVMKEYMIGDYDYASNVLDPTFPDGMEVEVFSFAALKKSWKEAQFPSQREHVTLYMRNRREFKKANVTHVPDLSTERWVLDTPQDLQLIEGILTGLYRYRPDFTMQDILAFKAENPGLFEINRAITRNEGYLRSLAESRMGIR
jgi:spore coat polysaccharide biosynthesis protein SpsF (cytidylyltransferase family)